MDEQRPYGGGPWHQAPGPAYPGPGPVYPPPGPAYPAAGHPGGPAAYPSPAPWPAGPYPPPYPLAVRNPSHGWVWMLVGALTLMALLVLGGGAWALTTGPETYGDDPRLDRLWVACEGGNMGACDDLYWESPLFSD
ncbi:MAG: hypothetical protein M3211_13005, partial [Actinomycetota bacterium]|nr:hypothetical protein [Actinomycetota bacterium]